MRLRATDQDSTIATQPKLWFCVITLLVFGGSTVRAGALYSPPPAGFASLHAADAMALGGEIYNDAPGVADQSHPIFDVTSVSSCASNSFDHVHLQLHRSILDVWLDEWIALGLFSPYAPTITGFRVNTSSNTSSTQTLVARGVNPSAVLPDGISSNSTLVLITRLRLKMNVEISPMLIFELLRPPNVVVTIF